MDQEQKLSPWQRSAANPTTQEDWDGGGAGDRRASSAFSQLLTSTGARGSPRSVCVGGGGGWVQMQHLQETGDVEGQME